MGTEGFKGALLATLLMVLLISLLSVGEVHASPDWTATWDSTSDWKGGTYENARVYNGSVDIGLYPPEPHFDGSSWGFDTLEITEVDILEAKYESGRAYFYARDKSALSSENGEAYAYAQITFYLDSAGVGTETLEFWWKGYSDDFNQGDGTTTLKIQLQKPGDSWLWWDIWSKTFDTPSMGSEDTETVTVPASLLDNSGYYKMRIQVYWYFDVTGILDTEKFEWHVDDISFGFKKGQHMTKWRDIGAMSAWKTIEASANIGAGESITARVQVSDDGISVKDYEEISLNNGTNTDYIYGLEDAQYVRIVTDFTTTDTSHTPELDKYTVTADPIPSLYSGDVTPDIDEIGSTFTYTVTYSDPDGDTPSVNVYIDGVEYNMAKISGTYTGGATYRFTTSTLDLGSHSYYFRASDGTSSVRLPTSGSYDGPTVVPPNQPPSLSSGSVSPSSGKIGTTFTYEVIYSDADGDAPGYVKVCIDGSPHSMSGVSGDYISGATYQYTTTSLNIGSHSYYFETSDGIDMDLSESYDGPTVVPNQPPSLSSGSVSPSSGTTGTTFTYEVTYTDADGDVPSYVTVYIDGTGHSMSKTSGTYAGGALYRYTTSSLGTGSHTYYFSTSDGTDTARLPSVDTYIGPSVSFGVTLTFRKPDGDLLAYTEFYYGSSEGQETSYLATTDSQGKITFTDSTLANQTVYFKSHDGRYEGSTYISSSGGAVDIWLSEVPSLPLLVPIGLLIIALVAAIALYLWRK